MHTIRTQVVIVGGGPAGLLLSHLLSLRSIESVVIEQRSRRYVMDRIRAGVIESGSATLLREAGLGARMDAEGFVHEGTIISVARQPVHIDFVDRVGKSVMVYGQTELTKDLYDAADRRGAQVFDECSDVTITDAATDSPSVTFQRNGEKYSVHGRFVAGCDGYHGVSRTTIPVETLRTYELLYPFGWLGILSETPPVSDELIYASHPDGFALCSMRNPNLSRYYVQCPTDDRVDDWSDDRFWETLRSRIPEAAATSLVSGPSIEKSITPLRSFVAEPLRFGSLFLAGDAAHIVPPTGAKGLNLAISDVHYLSNAFLDYFANQSSSGIDGYSQVALSRVWKAVRFSWWMTKLLHRFPDDDGTIQPLLQQAELDYLLKSDAAQTVLAENYVGLPF